MTDEPNPTSAPSGSAASESGRGGHGDLDGAVRREGRLYGVLAEYDTPGALIEGARKVREAGYTEFDCYSPFPVHGIDDAMGIRRTILPVIAISEVKGAMPEAHAGKKHQP